MIGLQLGGKLMNTDQHLSRRIYGGVQNKGGAVDQRTGLRQASDRRDPCCSSRNRLLTFISSSIPGRYAGKSFLALRRDPGDRTSWLDATCSREISITFAPPATDKPWRCPHPVTRMSLVRVHESFVATAERRRRQVESEGRSNGDHKLVRQLQKLLTPTANLI
jgi:hypothetical protein